VGNLVQINELNKQTSAQLSESEMKLADYIQSLPTLWPVSGNITSGYGERYDPYNNAKRFHDAIDIASDYGVSIKAAGKGRVVFVGWKDDVYGRTVILDHGYGITTMYSHASKTLVKYGQNVSRGTIIARVGNTGRSTGSHLHFNVKLNGSSVNPLDYLNSN